MPAAPDRTAPPPEWADHIIRAAMLGWITALPFSMRLGLVVFAVLAALTLPLLITAFVLLRDRAGRRRARFGRATAPA